MQAKIFFITLAVDDLDRSVAFYRDGLGWPTEGIVGQEFHDEVTGADGTIAFFKLDGGLLLGLYERDNLAKDASLPPGPPSSTEFSLGVPAESQAAVDSLLRQVEAAGGTLTAPAHLRPFGVYSGYFGAAAGVLMLALLTRLLADTLVRVNAVKNVLLGASNAVAAIGFIVFGEVVWSAALPLAAGLLVGNYIGPAIARRLPPAVLRIGIAVAGLVLAVVLFVDAV